MSTKKEAALATLIGIVSDWVDNQGEYFPFDITGADTDEDLVAKIGKEADDLDLDMAKQVRDARKAIDELTR